ncbi:ClpXP protease specificity-enhancing factor [Pokkaliibacter plantistimulans]|uniref:ClpXP protease specificity-enhancing factor n=1 Tax=Proteobacteria bacterium 228 TaxID=2083153 RepID=A0A2S5KIZ3_9PROT|nr:ClpXP protease specificity-enhancing factor [Pokkaliibacter plantistimulans]PPC74794.1 ClpXP protease specificity-enhancing factor [Pokkaliibacter plantistimulans]
MIPSRAFLARALYDWILENGWTPYVVVDAECPGVQVPVQHVQDGQIILNISPSAVQYLQMGNAELTFNARFGGVPMQVIAPIASVLAVYARENGQGMGFGMEPGADLLEQRLLEEATASSLEAVDSTSSKGDEPVEDADSKKKRPTLKVVK